MRGAARPSRTARRGPAGSFARCSASARGRWRIRRAASVRLSITVRCGKRLNCWKTIPIRWRTPETSAPLRVISSPRRRSARLQRLEQVDAAQERALPLPLGPMIVSTSPLATSRSIPRGPRCRRSSCERPRARRPAPSSPQCPAARRGPDTTCAQAYRRFEPRSRATRESPNEGGRESETRDDRRRARGDGRALRTLRHGRTRTPVPQQWRAAHAARLAPRATPSVDSYRRLADVFHDLLSEQSLDSLLVRIADTLDEIVPYEALHIYEADEPKRQLVPALVRSEYADEILRGRLPVRRRHHRLGGRAPRAGALEPGAPRSARRVRRGRRSSRRR